ncbi:MAG: trypsin-like peptidase domain-containing protein [Prosthecobacter sp.]|uniref:S1 family peptidase n=1 Tax=Prosthecobacter sp. TaxID=1965333 RepID=UPI0019E01BD4|nr:serine protease [Prosthecobacter sp.]MBE2282525.1 trypsin-like peptidase domain-containing protein [Prosthecobacter sp.]
MKPTIPSLCAVLARKTTFQNLLNITLSVFAVAVASGADQTREPSQMENEFTSLEEARAVETKLHPLSCILARSVVRLSGTGADKEHDQGSGVVIDPSGLILTHGHHDLPKEATLTVSFPNGNVVEAVIESVFSGRGRDFSLLKIKQRGRYPAVQLRREGSPAVGERCFHLGYPGTLLDVTKNLPPLLRLGRIAGSGRTSTYANCSIMSGDSGGPLFDFEGRLIGILDLSIGPELRHPGVWADIARILDGTTFLSEADSDEAVRLGFTNGKRKGVDTQRHIASNLWPELLASARRATVEVLIDGELAVLGTIIDPNGLVLTKRSEIMTHSGGVLGKLTCRLFDGREALASSVFDSQADDVAVLQLPIRGLTSAPWRPQTQFLRGKIVVVPIPGKEACETGAISADWMVKIESLPGEVELPVEMRAQGVTLTDAVRDLDNDFTKLIRGTLKAGDVITHVDEEATPDLAAYEKQTRSGSFVVGEFLRLTVLRDSVSTQVSVPIDSRVTERSYVDHSLRLTGFPSVIIHDTIVGRRQCGGPMVDLDGTVVGVNIARFGRTSTFAIPPQRIQSWVREINLASTSPEVPLKYIREGSQLRSSTSPEVPLKYTREGSQLRSN